MNNNYRVAFTYSLNNTTQTYSVEVVASSSFEAERIATGPMVKAYNMRLAGIELLGAA